MKRLYALGIAILTLVSLAGCNDTKEFAESLERTILLTATHEGVSPNTKTLRMEDGSTWWNPKEEISVFYGSGSNGGSKFTSKNTTLAETTEFEGSISMSGSKEFWAVYPYSIDNSCDGSSIITVIPSQQTGVEGNFSNDAFPAMGKSGSLTMPFYNICGGIKFFVSRTDINSVTFKGNNGEVLAGKVKVAFGADGKPEVAEVIEAQMEVTLTAPDGGAFKAGKYYYMTLLPGLLDGGFTMSFTTDSETGTLKSDKQQTIKRSVFGTLKNIDAKVQDWESTVTEPEYIDLGLPSGLKWASCNVGATKPEEFGDYFAWGETEPYYSSQNPLTWKYGKSSGYSWPSYKWCNGDISTLTKYNPNPSFGTVNYKTILVLEDDAAHINWGGSWRIPTDSEWTELRTKCTWTWTTENGVKGRKVTGPNGKSIFLPAAGCLDDTIIGNAESGGSYWSSALDTSYPYRALGIDFSPNNVYRVDSNRCRGLSVRPVYGEFISVSSITLDNSTLELTIGDSAQLNATVSPSNSTEPNVYWISCDENIVSVNKDGIISALAEGSTTIAAYASNGLSATCMVTVNNNLSKPDSVEAVDLGLPSGLKWASCNVGATKPEEYGAYFAWGETEPKDKYIWSNYKFELGTLNYGPFSKYVTNSSYGTLDNKTVLDTEDDAASANWGGNWRMPTDAEWTELRNNCSSEWKENNNGTGINGFLVTGPNNKSIFLPAAGYQRSTSTLGNVAGYYCSSSLDKDGPSEAWLVDFYPNTTSRGTGARCYGYPVRPVYGEFIHVESITLDNTSLELTVGDSAPLTATISPSNATEPTVRWVSEDESIVSVDQTGSVSALTEGSTTITAYSSNGLSASCSITVNKKKPNHPVDLSSSGTANCYIVPAEGTYCFRANKGNSNTALTGASAEILWRSFNTNEKPGADDIIVNPVYQDGYVYFSTAKEFKEGNAVIAVKSLDGTILWSWHIWVTTADLENLKQTYANDAGVMMDRNLGALSAEAGNPLSFGLLYEWGRKDPFTGCASYESTTPMATDAEWPPATMTRATNQQGETALEYSIKHPMQYIYNSELPYDWQALSQDECDHYLWNSKKTIYDPCPLGWRVPDGGDEGIWKKAGIPEASLYNTALKGIWIVAPYCSPNAWYPSIGGGRQWNGGNINHVGEWGNYWSSTYMYESWMDEYPQTWNYYYDFDFYASETRSKSHSYSGQGQAVRCCKE